MKFTNIDKIYGVVLYAIIVVAFLYTQGCTLVGLKINDLLGVFEDCQIDAVMHFAGLKAVGESVKDPFSYYSSNVIGTLNILEATKLLPNLKNCLHFIKRSLWKCSNQID